MRVVRLLHAAALPLLATLVTSCGGGGSSMSSAPSPIAAPTPTPAPTSAPIPSSPGQVVLLRQPATQEFTVFGVGEPFRIRYDAGSAKYEVNATGSWLPLFQATPAQNSVFIGTNNPETAVGSLSPYTRSDSGHPPGVYLYSSWSSWWAAPGRGGQVAFGAATPASAVPVTGTAGYSGFVGGITTAAADGGGWGIFQPAPVEGTIALQADFAKGTLSGTVKAGVYCDCIKVPAIPQVDFSGTIAAGQNALSGQFSSALAGPNYLRGLFAGPGAEETFGEWAFPYSADGKVESAIGVWVAKR